MVERAEREPTMEEIVVALRETKRSADRMHPYAVAGPPPRGPRGLRTVGSADHTDLRDSEIQRLLAENARLNERVVSLLKVIEQEQLRSAEAAATETTSSEVDRDAIYREVRAALETELSPLLVVLLRLLERQHTEPTEAEPSKRRVGFPAMSEGGPSDWIIDLMRKLENTAPAPNDTVDPADGPRRPKLRERMTDVLNALRLEPYAGTPRRRPASPEEHP
jgi:hypothetical protein